MIKKVFAFLLAAVAAAFAGYAIGMINHPDSGHNASAASSTAKSAVSSANSNQGDDATAQSQTSSTTATSQTGATAKVQSVSQAVAVVRAALGNRAGVVYSLLSQGQGAYRIQATTQAGTVLGVYTVNSNGTYQAAK